MNDIEKYINHVADDFMNYVDNAASLCELISMDYRGNSIPDYTNVHVQQLYLLRYAYAYSYEYTLMYKQVLKQLGNVPQISVVSVGCGTMLDYWSLLQAMAYSGHFEQKVHYVGIDMVEWNYRFNKREKDSIRPYLQNNAVECFQNNPKFVSDIYFFPKSISEFTIDEIGKIAECFEKKRIEKERFFLCVSMRNTHQKREDDMEKVRTLIQAIEKNNFRADDGSRKIYAFTEHKGIAGLDRSYHYPKEPKLCLESLDDNCKQRACRTCNRNCNLSRRPVLKTEQICYQIIGFERRKAA